MSSFTAEFLGDYHDIMSNVSTLIKSSEEFACIITPYMNWNDEIYRILKVAENKKTPILIILRDPNGQQYNNQLLKELSKFSNIVLFYCKDLHAKIYLSETLAILPSKNLYERKDEKCSVEVGIKTEDQSGIFEILRSIAELKTSIEQSPILKSDEVLSYFERLLELKNFGNYSNIRTLIRECKKTGDSHEEPHYDGFCIRCGKEIAFSPNSPLCLECWQSWVKYSDSSYRENYCHGCKEKSDYRRPITFANPLCQVCTRKLRIS